jgi:hypothetical protein
MSLTPTRWPFVAQSHFACNDAKYPAILDVVTDTVQKRFNRVKEGNTHSLRTNTKHETGNKKHAMNDLELC